jgi:hypothetical protein
MGGYFETGTVCPDQADGLPTTVVSAGTMSPSAGVGIIVVQHFNMKRINSLSFIICVTILFINDSLGASVLFGGSCLATSPE